MKKFFFAAALACVALVSQPVAAQVAPTNFAPVGAEWWYRINTISGPQYAHIVSVGDSTVAGQTGTWRYLMRQDFVDPTGSGTFSPTLPPTPYVYTQCRDAAIWYAWANTAAPSWPMRLLDFSLPRRSMMDTVWMCQNLGATIQMVDSVGTMGRGGRVLRTQVLSAPTFPSPTTELRQYTGRVVEEFGYPYAIIVPRLECGTDPDMPQIEYYNDGNGITFGVRPQGILSVKEAVATRHLSVAPNPSANGRFRLDGLGNKTATYAIYDGQGRRVRTGKLTAADASINLADLPGGLYTLRGEMAGEAFSRRLVRE